MRDIDAGNPARIYFHIGRQQPTAVILYLRAERFSPLYYTELARHDHEISMNIALKPHIDHSHPIEDTEEEPLIRAAMSNHGHQLNFLVHPGQDIDGAPNEQGLPYAFTMSNNAHPRGEVTRNPFFVVDGEKVITANALDDRNLPDDRIDKRAFYAFTGDYEWAPGDTIDETLCGTPDGGHKHRVALNSDTGSAEPVLQHELTEDSTIEALATGVEPHLDYGVELRTGRQLAYVDALQVWIDGVDRTTDILTQIQNANPAENWNNVLGDGTKDHPLVVPHDEPPRRRDGTGPIRLDSLPNTNFTEGEHYITFRVEELTDEDGNDLGNGGRIHYNLYVA
jgi:hypothetical protein